MNRSSLTLLRDESSRCFVRTYIFLRWQWYQRGGEGLVPIRLMGGRYTSVMACVAGEWKIEALASDLREPLYRREYVSLPALSISSQCNLLRHGFCFFPHISVDLADC
jgi:hypothetical protein